MLTERLILRTLEATDAEAVYAYQVDPEVSRYQNWPFLSIDSIRAFLVRQTGIDPFTSTDWFQIGITLRESLDQRRVGGRCGFRDITECNALPA